MNDLQNSLLESMSILAKSASQSTPATLTVEAVIVNAIDISSGLYLVEYLGNKFKAYADVTSKYSSGELVYVLIPNGDFTKNKVILRAVTPTVKNYIEETSNKIEYSNISGNLLNYSDKIALCSYRNGVFPVVQGNIQIALDNLKRALKDYLEKGEVQFQLETKVQTNITGQNYGNFGLILDIPTAGGGVKRFILDTKDIIGNPYALKSGSPQSKIFTLENIDINRNIELYAFIEQFIEGEENIDYESDIFFSNLDISVVEPITTIVDTSGYKLILTATDGSIFLSKTDKTITPKLYVNNNETSFTGLNCYWFEEDAMIELSSKDYLQEGGIGWRCINKKISTSTNAEGIQNIYYNLNEYFYSLSYSSFDEISSKRYKCVINYNGILISNIIEIKNYTDSAPFRMELFSINGATSFIKGNDIDVKLVCELKNYNVLSNDDLVYIWYRYDKEGNFIEKDFVNYDEQSQGIVKVSFPTNVIEVLNTIRCFIYVVDEDSKKLKLLASNSIDVSIATSEKYFATVSPNNLLYKYDEDGDSPLIADYDGPSPVSGIEPLQIHIYKQNGIELTDGEYNAAKIIWTIPKESLFKVDESNEDDLNYIISGRNLSYTIADNFNRNNAQNKIVVDIDIDGTILHLEPNIQFFKENESGLNGSKYTALIQYNGKSYNPFSVLKGENLVLIKHSYEKPSWYTFDINGNIIDFKDIQLGIKVYQDNKILDNSNSLATKILYSVEWSLFDYTTDHILTCDNFGILNINKSAKNSIEHCVIQAKVIISNINGEQDVTNIKEVLYCYYPIDIINYISEEKPENVLLPLMTGGYNFVTYSKDGINPKYDTTQNFKLVCTYNGFDESNRFGGHNWSISDTSALTLEHHGNSSIQTVVPINRYDQQYSGLSVAITSTPKEIKEELDKNPPSEQMKIQEITRYNTNKECLITLLNYTDNFYKNIWISKVDKCTNLLSYREAIILELNKLNAILDNILMIDSNDVQALEFKIVIKNMLDDVYDFTEIDYTNYLLDLSYQTTNGILKILGEDFNERIIVYNAACTNLIKYSKTSEYSEARLSYLGDESITGIRNVNVKRIPGIHQSESYLLDQYKIVRDKIDTIINGVKYQLSTASLIEYFANIPVILKYYGKLENGIYILNDSLNKWFNNEINLIEQDFNKNLNKYLCDVKQKNSENVAFTITRPIVFLYDRDGLSTVQGWDGNKLYVSNGNNQEYLTSLSAAVGTQSQSQTYGLRAAPAGFSGIALGTHVEDTVREQGLYGYHNGQQTFMLNATTGVASFGKPGGGQIILDPSSADKGAILKSGDYVLANKDQGEEGKGMEINLSKPSITFGNGKFSVNEKGQLSASEVSISGNITATSGTFDGEIIANENSKFYGNIEAFSGTFSTSLEAKTAIIGKLKFEGNTIKIINADETEKEFISENGTINISSEDLGELHTKVGSSIGGWLVLGSDTQQYLQGNNLILNPQAGSINYENVTLTTSGSANIKNGFYLGKDGFNIPNVIKIEPTKPNNEQIWQLDSSKLSWYDTTNSMMMTLGGEEINLLNTFYIHTSDYIITDVSIDVPTLQLYSSKDDRIVTDIKSECLIKSEKKLTIENIGNVINITSDNISFNEQGFAFYLNNNIVFNTYYEDLVSQTHLNADNVYLGKNDNISIYSDNVILSSGTTLKIGNQTLSEEDLRKLKALIN